jgi:hypothetical protein
MSFLVPNQGENEEEEPPNKESSEESTNDEPTDDNQDEEVVFSMGIPPDAAPGRTGEPGEILFIIVDDDEEEELLEEDEEEDEEEVLDPYTEKASSEFVSSGSGLDWGGALGKLRDRVSDVETGASQSPSKALFRIMTSKTPNQLIGEFVSTANPQVVNAMTGAISSLLGGLSSPAMGVETIVKASGEKIGSLCFQLQMTG